MSISNQHSVKRVGVGPATDSSQLLQSPCTLESMATTRVGRTLKYHTRVGRTLQYTMIKPQCTVESVTPACILDSRCTIGKNWK